MTALPLTDDELMAEAQATLQGEPLGASDAVVDEENATLSPRHQPLLSGDDGDAGWRFIDRQRQRHRLQRLLASPTLSHTVPVVKALSEEKTLGLPGYEAVMAALDRLEQEAPNSRELLVLVKSQIHLHYLTFATDPLRLMPTLLVGPPGVGKTFVVRRLAECLGLHHDRIALSNATEAFVLSGCPQGYATATPGEVAEKLAQSDIINPLIILDELDKATFTRHDRATVEGPLLTLLEPETAIAFEDSCLRLTLDASHVSWFGTANRVEAIPEPILSRFLVLPIGALAPGERERLLARQVESLLADMGLADRGIQLSPSAVQYLATLPVRTLRNTLRLSIARKLLVSPLDAHLALAETDIVKGYRPELSRRPMGFQWEAAGEGSGRPSW